MSKMTPDQEIHLSFILGEVVDRVDQKYRRGQVEHGGNLEGMTIELLVVNAIDKAVDQLVYLLTLQQKLNGSSLP